MTTTIPPLETQVAFLFDEMHTGDGGNIAKTFDKNPGMTPGEAATAFERRFEKSDVKSAEGQAAFQRRITNANDVYNAYSNGTLTSLPANAQYVFNQAVEKGYTAEQAAGIVGNLQVESGKSINPNSINRGDGRDGSDSVGIAQWNQGRSRNLVAYDPATGEIVPNTEVQAGDIDATTGDPVTETEAREVREEARAESSKTKRENFNHYIDNPLNVFSSYTYNWSVHIFHPLNAGKFSNLKELRDSGSVITLSQSGVENEISIDSVAQHMALQFSDENRNSVANVFNINFVEPLGATFYTRIFTAAQRLGIENHLDSIYLLELNLLGWDENSTKSTVIGPYLYETKLISLQMEFRDGASHYQGRFIEVSQDAYSRNSFHLTSQISIDVTNFGDFLTKLEDEVNKQKLNQAAASQFLLYPDAQYHFTTTPAYNSWKNFTFDAIAPSEVDQTRGVSISASGGTLHITLPKGTAITAAMAMVLFQTREFKNIVTKNGFAKESSDEGVANPVKLAEIVRWISFKTEVQYRDLDPLVKQYPKDITFQVMGHITPEATHDPKSNNALVNDNALQGARLNELYVEDLLLKRYDYTSTGLNTEVIQVDIVLNNIFYQLQALNAGKVDNTSALFNGSAAEQHAIGLKNDITAIERERKTSAKAISQLKANTDKIKSEAIGGPPGGEISAAAAIAQNTQNIDLETAKIKRLLLQKEALQGKINLATAQLLEDRNTNFTPLLTTSRRYLTQDELATKASYSQFLPNGFQHQEVQSLSTSNGPEKPEFEGAAMLGALEINLNSTGDLIQQNLIIRGDPYWLGRPKGFENDRAQAHYENGGLTYFLNVNLPTYPNETTGLPRSTNNFMITGVYRVITVDANYSNGQFTMTLNSFRDLNTNSDSMYESLIAGHAIGASSSNSGPRTGPPGRTTVQRNSTVNNPR